MMHLVEVEESPRQECITQGLLQNSVIFKVRDLKSDRMPM
jgi:hypothetical protein